MRSLKRKEIPIIDVFAGPGGLGEGFSRAFDSSGERRFRVALSIEKDPIARHTLMLRSFYRQFAEGEVPDDYFRRLRGEITNAELFDRYADEYTRADWESWRAELASPEFPLDLVRSRVEESLSLFREPRRCILIGGPPCQAYSLAGRSRNKGNEDYVFEKDARTRLYIEYLQMLADFRPAVFVLENVKGMLSSKYDGNNVFERIAEDLREPVRALHREGRSVRGWERTRYTLRPLAAQSLFPTDGDPRNYVIHCERFGIPQARHRVVIVGVRQDLDASKLLPLSASAVEVSLGQVIGDLPRLRSGLSKDQDGRDEWKAAIQTILEKRVIGAIRSEVGEDVAVAVEGAASKAGRDCPDGRGGEFVSGGPCVQINRKWFVGSGKIRGFCNHATRAHIAADLHRYLFAAAFAQKRGRSPALSDFPAVLYPRHRNIRYALDGSMFADRFRVQLADRPATTITSHISKDGHYYIHPDPSQCRSLTVRESARLQTFPDDYFFEGQRTAQYHQVGNAVPPLIAHAIASSVLSVLD
jgi:DNA (cytosine-5)-methyltransferase 1